ncbi:MAG: glycosyltransferase family A protein, partial [Muribaculaceae bacterium]
LNCVAAQTYRPLNLILVDNNSTDASLQVLRDFKEANQASDFRISVLQETTPGACAARNCGLLAAKSEWIMFFDSDDLMTPDYVEQYSKAMKADPDADIFAIRLQLDDGKGIRQLAFVPHDIFANHIIHSMLSTQRYIARRKHFIEAGCWNRNTPTWDDWELGIRMLLSRPKIHYISDKARVTAVFQNESITGDNFHSKHGTWEHAIDIAESDIANSDIAEKDRLIYLLNYRRVVLAAHYRREKCFDLADALYRNTLERYRHNFCRRAMLAVAYRYISAGGRGFGRLISTFF